MINMYEVSETNKMIEHENLDVRTITLGISLLDCVDSNLEELNRKIYDKITTLAKDLVSTGQDIEKEFGIPIVNNGFPLRRSPWSALRHANVRKILWRWQRRWIARRKKSA